MENKEQINIVDKENICGVTLLHISDIHRVPDNPISNCVLIDSLENDLEQYKEEGIPLPDLIVVSGDVVNGVKGDKEEDIEKLRLQYDEAYEFLVQLCDKFLGGDREKVIIVPGNHDVNWYYSKNAMKLIEHKDIEAKKTTRNSFLKGNDKIRWCWDTFEFLNIDNQELYNKRFLLFSDFYTKFYQDKRKFKLDPKDQYDIFDFPQYKITIVGFNSCYLNDHCNYKGKIHSACISNASLKLRDEINKDERIMLAVWHHNTRANHNKVDYMDSSTLQKLIIDGYSIGLHGHQHKTEILYEETLISHKNKLLLFSAGSLCATAREIPRGHTRQYNLIHLDFKNKQIVLNVRKALEEVDEDFLIWVPVPEYKNSIYNFNETDKGKLKKLDEKLIMDSITLISNENFQDALKILMNISKNDENKNLIERLLIDCYIGLGDTDNIIKNVNDPSTPQEIIALIDAFKIRKDVGNINKILEKDSVRNCTDFAVIQFCNDIRRWLEIYGKRQ